MRLNRYLLVFFCISGISKSYAASPLYMYPVAAFERFKIPHMLVLQQWSLDKLELYDWDIVTGDKAKVLMSLYTPAAVKILPDQSGFSFVDNGRIRIKRFDKRAVKSLDIYEPVYGIELINWLDNQTCYFHAQSDGHYGIYTLTLEEEMTLIRASPLADYMYPNIVDQTIFCIEHVTQGEGLGYRVIKQAMSDTRIQVVADFGLKPIIMLTMQSAHEGFVLECGSKANFQSFYYHELVQNGISWQVRELFSFQVPRDLFDGPNRIYESIIPLVPCNIGHFIYFSSYDEVAQRLVLYRFDKQTNRSERFTQAVGHLFPPVFIDCQGWSGGTCYPVNIISLQKLY